MDSLSKQISDLSSERLAGAITPERLGSILSQLNVAVSEAAAAGGSASIPDDLEERISAIASTATNAHSSAATAQSVASSARAEAQTARNSASDAARVADEAKELAKSALDNAASSGPSWWSGSQEEYDALTEIDPATLYFVY